MVAGAQVRDGSRMDTDPCRTAVDAVDVTDRAALARATERLAADHLVAAHGLTIVATNLRVALEDLRGELDVVAQDPVTGLLVVCEVKARTGATGAGASETLGARQQGRIRRMTSVLLAQRTLRARQVRFDLVTVDLGAPRHCTSATLRHHAGAW